MGWLYETLKLKIDQYFIVDDIFPEEVCKNLKDLAVDKTASLFTTDYYGYYGQDYRERMEDISDLIKSKVSIAKAKTYQRSWSFVCDNVSRGVFPHVDPSSINVNIWLTTDECVEDHNKNGLRIYKKNLDPLIEWNQSTRNTYNQDPEFVEKYLNGVKYDIIPYRYNRAVIFSGKTFHSTHHVHMKPGDENRRVNYTFLYD